MATDSIVYFEYAIIVEGDFSNPLSPVWAHHHSVALATDLAEARRASRAFLGDVPGKTVVIFEINPIIRVSANTEITTSEQEIQPKDTWKETD